MPTESDLGRRVYPSELGQSVMGNDSVRLVDECIKRLCQRRSNNASAGRSKNTSAMLTRRPPNWGPFRQASSLRGIILRGIGAGRP